MLTGLSLYFRNEHKGHVLLSGIFIPATVNGYHGVKLTMAEENDDKFKDKEVLIVVQNNKKNEFGNLNKRRWWFISVSDRIIQRILKD